MVFEGCQIQLLHSQTSHIYFIMLNVLILETNYSFYIEMT